MIGKRIMIGAAVLLLLAAVGTASALTDQEQLGKLLFADTNLSTPAGQGCVSCHDPAFAFTDPDKNLSVSGGVVAGRFGSRNAPSAAYGAFSPDFGFIAGGFGGGQFWDGRAANLTEQAKGPFLNPLEMNNTGPAEVLNKIQAASYAPLFNTVCVSGDTQSQYTCMAAAIAAFEKTPLLNKFSSKFDLNQTGMTAQDQRGFSLFNTKGKCDICHRSTIGPFAAKPIFTDFEYMNIGVPSNLGMLGDTAALQAYFPFYYPPLAPEFNTAGLNFVDTGLTNNPAIPVILQPSVKGLMKVPTLRNIELTSPYMHNGVFRTLKEIVHFYNTRDILGNCANTSVPQPGVNCWPAPEVPDNLNKDIGNLGLTDAEENDIVAFLLTLTDGSAPSPSQQPPPGTPVLTDQEQLGKLLFADTNLSTPAGQGCVSCHDPAFAFTDPDKNLSVSGGIVAGRFGSRNAPSAAYGAFSPEFGFIAGGFGGGQFWDGRAANLTEQAKGPFLNPLEMNNTGPAEVLNKIQAASYASLFNTVCGAQSDQYTCMAAAIAAFEKTPLLNKFSSKFDLNQTGMTAQEQRGFSLFNTRGKCDICHRSTIGPFAAKPIFTDFEYVNIGVPSNLGMLGDTAALQAYFPFYYPPLAPEFNTAGLNFVDTGLANNPAIPVILQPSVKGLIKVPTLRNIELTSPYMHNGVFRTLKEIVHFYNTRDILGNCANTSVPQPGVNCWPAPEVPDNLNKDIGNLGLTDAEENDIVAFLLTLTDGSAPSPSQQPPLGTPVLTDQEQLGKLLFADTNLSTPAGQSCQSCHVPDAGFTDPRRNRAVSPGIIPGRFGNRNAPSAAYAALTPEFNSAGGIFTGGQFWDGRAANLTEQAKGPFLNPLEMNNPDKATVLNNIKNATYAPLFNTVCGGGDTESQYTCMADAIAAFERTNELNTFSSKFDFNPTELSVQEMRGLALFNGKALCSVCHEEPFFTNFNYINIGVPSNLGMLGDTAALQSYFPFYYPPLAPEFNPDGLNFTDMGLANNPNVPLIQKPTVTGMVKIPTLRNIWRTAPYMHNGVFKTLKEVVHFYNTRDVLGNCASKPNPQPGVNCWPAPEVTANLNTVIGNLGLTNAEEDDILAFLLTLNDGFVPPTPGTPALNDQEQLGKLLFKDTNLSTPAGQSCQSCHDPAFAFTEPDKNRSVSGGATPGRFGNRNAPSLAYVANMPDFGLRTGEFIGGLFWDGRATNLTEQAKGPFLNPLEMNNTGPAEVLNKIQAASYAPLFNKVCANQSDRYTCTADSIAAFEKTPEMNKFNSKFDQNPNLTGLTAQEQRGLLLFNGKAKCFICHPGPFFFTDFDYANNGVPSNLGILGDTAALQAYFPFYYPPLAPAFNPDGLNFADIGLAGNPNVPPNLKSAVKGMMKAPTLRNVALTSPYMHNGVFKDLKTVVHFYNTRDTLGNCAVRTNPLPGVNCWPAPEVPVNLNTVIGNLGLTDAEENDIVAFLNTLTDDFVPSPPAITAQEQLGKLLFTDTNLSTPVGQSCQSCHDPFFAFTEPDKTRSVSGGIVADRFGNRNAPSAAYVALIPDFGFAGGVFTGGLFWDGRAANLTEQAKGPFLNPLEMNNPDKAAVLDKIKNASYSPLFNTVCGSGDTGSQYTCTADAIAAFERTPELNKFSSKFDISQNLTGLTFQEKRGFALFSGKTNCHICHRPPYFFTDSDFENIGVPSNLGMSGDTAALQSYFPFYYPPLAPAFNPDGLNFADTGLAGNPNVPANQKSAVTGMMKAPTLRNVALTAPYMHNGVFKDLKTVVHFYNTRDVLGNCANEQNPQPGVNCWPAPEMPVNLNLLVGDLRLTDAEENDIVAFLNSLTDTQPPTGTVTGTVTNARSILAEPGVKVAVGVTAVLTNATGFYSISFVPGTYTVTASKAGFLTSTTGINITAGATTMLNITLQPRKVIRGDVNQNPGLDVGDVLFAAQFVAGMRTPTPAQEALADVNGNGIIDVGDVLFIAQAVAGLRTL